MPVINNFKRKIMKTMRLCLCLCAVFCVNSLFAQEELGNGLLFPEFEKGIVTFKNGTRSTSLLNYNMQMQEMLFMDKENNIMALANLTDILVVSIGERRFFPSLSGGVFYEEIRTEHGSFFVQHRATILSQGKAAGYGGYSQTSATTSIGSYYGNDANKHVQLKPDEKFMQKRDDTFYLKAGNSYKKFTSAKTLGKLFRGQAPKIEQFAKDKSIDFSKTDDIAKIVDYGFSLTEK